MICTFFILKIYLKISENVVYQRKLYNDQRFFVFLKQRDAKKMFLFAMVFHVNDHL